MKRYLVAVAAAALAAVALYSPAQHAQADVLPGMHVAVVGDMACDTSNSNYNGGLGSATDCQQMAVSQKILDDAITVGGGWSAVLGLGDFQYDCGDPGDWTASYTPSFGRLDSFMDPAPGNHEYKTGNDVYGQPCPSSNSTAAGYFDHFGDPSYYSFDLGSWHIISLNANCNRVGGCSAGKPETNWLQTDLANTTQPCIAAFWHQPLYTGQGTGYSSTYKPWWDALYAAQADLVLNGHVHNYQRFAPLNSSRGSDPTSGITEYIVGTGGEKEASVAASASPQPQYWKKAFGYMQLDLTDTGWHSVFKTVDGQSLDDWTGTCH